MMNLNVPEQITKEVINTSAEHCANGGRCKYCGLWAEERCAKHFASALIAKCAEVEELRGLINEVLPVGDIADGLAPYYIEADTIRRMRKALEGKE